DTAQVGYARDPRRNQRAFFFKQKTAYEIGLGIPAEPLFRSDATPFNQILKQNAKREMRVKLGKVTVADVLAAQPVTTNLLKFMRASIKMIGVSNLQSFIASMTQKLTLSDRSEERRVGKDSRSR